MTIRNAGKEMAACGQAAIPVLTGPFRAARSDWPVRAADAAYFGIFTDVSMNSLVKCLA